MGRLKVLVGQTRAQCANEVRKRERTIEGLKKHVADGGRARGTGKMVGVVSITVTAGVGAEGVGGQASTDSPGYDLRMETNEFLTELARGLSEENENVGSLLRRTVETLRTLSGCEKEQVQEDGMVVQMDSGYENLASEMEDVIDHLRNLLTNPSFVPLEEVEVREEEIIRLREGWEKMEARWKEAVMMMDGWRKRMARSGQTVNLEELKMGLRLSPLKPKDDENDKAFQLSTLMEEGEGDTQADIDAMDEEDFEAPMEEPDLDELDSDEESSLFEDEPLDEESAEAPEEQNEFSLNSISSMSPGPPPQLSPLRETTNGNKGASPQYQGFTTIIEENTADLLQLKNMSPEKPKRTPNVKQQEAPPIPLSPSDEVSLLKTSNISQRSSPKKSLNRTPISKPASSSRLKETASSRLPRPRDNPPPQQSPLTMASIAAKLAATEREADAARVRAKLKAARMKGAPTTNVNAHRLKPPPTTKENEEPSKSDRDAEEPDFEERMMKKRKAPTRQGGRASRRRSTLNPWELESLIRGAVDGGD